MRVLSLVQVEHKSIWPQNDTRERVLGETERYGAHPRLQESKRAPKRSTYLRV